MNSYQHLVVQENGVLIPHSLFGKNELILDELHKVGALAEPQNGSAESVHEIRKELKPIRRVPMIDMSREFQWLKEHKHEYIGKWVVVEGDQLISVNDTGKEAYAAGHAAGIESPFVEYISPIDDLPFGGW